jgi:hypothetical protein
MIVADEPREGRDAAEERLEDREFPLHVDVPRPVWLPHDVDGPRPAIWYAMYVPSAAIA